MHFNSLSRKSAKCLATIQEEEGTQSSIPGTIVKHRNLLLSEPRADDLGGLELVQLADDDDSNVAIATQLPRDTLSVG